MSSERVTPRPWSRVQAALRPLSEFEREKLRQALEEFPEAIQPIVVMPDGRIVDGHHRFELAGPDVPYRVMDIREDSAFRLSMVYNAARRQLTEKETREALERDVADHPDAPTVELAARHHTTERSVRRARDRIYTGTPGPGVETTTTRSGATRRKPVAATDAERRQARLLQEEGHTQVEIARRLNRPPATINLWLTRAPRNGGDPGRERLMRNQRAWRGLVDLNTRGLAEWRESGRALLLAIETCEEANALVALAQATQRTREILDRCLTAIDIRLSDEDRQKVAAFLGATDLDRVAK